jgi:hypothetical protein
MVDWTMVVGFAIGGVIAAGVIWKFRELFS